MSYLNIKLKYYSLFKLINIFLWYINFYYFFKDILFFAKNNISKNKIGTIIDYDNIVALSVKVWNMKSDYICY